MCFSFGFCLQDDTYIGLRYSRNLAEGHGLVFNPGEHVDGYPNFSWIMLSAIPILFDADVAVFLEIWCNILKHDNMQRTRIVAMCCLLI